MGRVILHSWYRRLRQTSLAWQLLNVPARIRWLRSRRPLAPAERGAVAALEACGIAIVHASALAGPERVDELRRMAEARWQTRRGIAPPSATDTKGSYLVDLWGGEHVLLPGNPFLQFSLSTPILNVVNAYLGMCAKFREFFLQATVPRPGARTVIASQRWHADPDDRKLVKVFLYLNDVDETAGPFTYIRYTHSGGKWRKLFPYAPKRLTRHPDPAFIQANIPKEDFVTATGRAGTLIFCDTSGIHRGGYATSRERIMYTSVYTTPASYLPTRFSYPPDFDPARLETAQARYAVSPKRL